MKDSKSANGMIVGLVIVFLWSEASAEVTVTTLASFGQANGSNPAAEMIAGRDGNFYGTTLLGGANNFGAVFKLAPDWTITALASFNSNNGAYPRGGLTQTASGEISLYGATAHGGANGLGNVFRVGANGALSTLHDFTGPDGANPEAGLAWENNGNLLGVTFFGGTNGQPIGYGTVFEITTEGVQTKVLSFNNTNGANPYANLIQGQDGNFYGTTQLGGSSSDGTVFRLSPSGVVSTVVSFQGANGSLPLGRVVQDVDGKLYGTASEGGDNDLGTVYRLTTNGVLTTLVSFAVTNGSSPRGGLTRGGDGAFYGVTALGGTNGKNFGTVFRVTTNGILTTLISFNGTNGAYPLGSLAQGADGNLYGTTSKGGTSDNGTVFRLDLSSPVAPVILSVNEANGTLHGTYSAVAGQNYQVFYRTSLSTGNWIALGGLVSATNSVMPFSDTIGPNPMRFYIVALVP